MLYLVSQVIESLLRPRPMNENPTSSWTLMSETHINTYLTPTTTFKNLLNLNLYLV